MKKVDAAEVRRELFSLQDRDYAVFHGGLLPGTEHIIGVRIPKLRAMARTLAKMDWREWFAAARDEYYEETMLRGLTMAYAEMTCKERLEYLRAFVPHIDNWAVCDCVTGTLKDAKSYPAEYWDFLEPYLHSDKEYEARFAAVMLLSHFVKAEYLQPSLSRLESIRQEGYYAKMGVAWAVSVYFAAFPEEMLDYLQSRCRLDAFTRKKALQKILESYRVDPEMKSRIRELRQRG